MFFEIIRRIIKYKRIYISNQGIGDTLFVLLLLKERNEKCIVFCKKPHHFIKKLIENTESIKLLETGTTIFRIISFIKPLFCKRIIDTKLEEPLCKLLGYNSITLLDIYKAKMNVSMHYTPRVKDNQEEETGTVILLPDANSVQELNSNYWEKLAQGYNERGKRVEYYSKKIEIMNAKKIEDNIGLEELWLKCMRAEYVYSLRSGICDLLVYSGKKKITVCYPNVMWWSSKMINSCSLNKIFAVNIREIIN